MINISESISPGEELGISLDQAIMAPRFQGKQHLLRILFSVNFEEVGNGQGRF
jgi:hypothetical protein